MIYEVQNRNSFVDIFITFPYVIYFQTNKQLFISTTQIRLSYN